jgi:hypothetical protein
MCWPTSRALPADRVGPLGDRRLRDAPGRPHRGRGQQRRRHGRGDASHGRPKRGVYRGPRLARQGGACRTGGGALPAGPSPSHRHLPATRRPDDKFYLGYRPGRGGYSPDRVDALVWAFSELLVEQTPGENVFELYRRQAEAAAQRSKPQPAQTVPQPGSMEWFKAQQNKAEPSGGIV